MPALSKVEGEPRRTAQIFSTYSEVSKPEVWRITPPAIVIPHVRFSPFFATSDDPPPLHPAKPLLSTLYFLPSSAAPPPHTPYIYSQPSSTHFPLPDNARSRFETSRKATQAAPAVSSVESAARGFESASNTGKATLLSPQHLPQFDRRGCRSFRIDNGKHI